MGELKGILGSGNDKTTGLLIIPTLRELPYNESTFAATGLFRTIYRDSKPFRTARSLKMATKPSLPPTTFERTNLGPRAVAHSQALYSWALVALLLMGDNPTCAFAA